MPQHHKHTIIIVYHVGDARRKSSAARVSGQRGDYGDTILVVHITEAPGEFTAQRRPHAMEPEQDGLAREPPVKCLEARRVVGVDSALVRHRAIAQRQGSRELGGVAWECWSPAIITARASAEMANRQPVRTFPLVVSPTAGRGRAVIPRSRSVRPRG